jgi:hypothetical protein
MTESPCAPNQFLVYDTRSAGSFMRSTARHRTVGYKVCLLSASLLYRPSTANMGSDGFEATESLGGWPYFILLGMHGR